MTKSLTKIKTENVKIKKQIQSIIKNYNSISLYQRAELRKMVQMSFIRKKLYKFILLIVDLQAARKKSEISKGILKKPGN